MPRNRVLHDDVEYPGHGMPEDHEAPRTLYALLAKGRPLGKKTNVLVAQLNRSGGISGSCTILEIRGDDEAAMNLQVTLAPPKVIAVDSNFTVAQAETAVQKQDASGTKSNDDRGLVAPNFEFTPILARLEWGVKGYSNDVVYVDMANGLCVNLTASYLRINAEVDPLLNIIPALTVGDPAVYELAAFVGPGWAKPRNAQRTIRLPLLNVVSPGIDSGTSPIVPIPKYATGVRVVASNGNGVVPIIGWLATVVFFASPGTGPTVLTPDLTAAPVPFQVGHVLVADNGIGPGANMIPIPNGAYYCAVINNSGDAIAPSLIFDLGI